jgi:acetyl-CoA acyltransferase
LKFFLLVVLFFFLKGYKSEKGKFFLVKDAVIVCGARTAVGKAPDGTLRDVRPEDLAGSVLQETMKRAHPMPLEEIEDVILGCAMPEGEQGLNIARLALFRAGFPASIPAITINRFCASGLQAIAFAVERIQLGSAQAILAGGVESMSLIPMGGRHFSANPYLAEHYPQAYITMGLTGEHVAKKYGITREMQDVFALKSHQNAVKAISEGKFKDEIFSFQFERKALGKNGKPQIETIVFEQDEGPRVDTSLEKLAKLKPVFQEGGTITAGNASQTSDGSAAVLVVSEEKARAFGLKPLGRLLAYAVAGVAPELMGIGPVEAIPKALKQAGLKLSDIGLIELNEAFAAQALAVVQHLDINPDIVNVNGGAIALGHPLGCTGAKLTLTLLYEMQRQNIRYGMVTMCIGGGMGAAGIFELL